MLRVTNYEKMKLFKWKEMFISNESISRMVGYLEVTRASKVHSRLIGEKMMGILNLILKTGTSNI